MGIDLVEADKDRIAARLEPPAGPPGPIEAIAHGDQGLGDEVAVAQVARPDGDVGLVALQADRPQVRRQVDVQARMLCRQPGEARDEKPLGNGRRRIDAHEAAHRVFRRAAADGIGRRLHVARGRQDLPALGRQHIAVGATIDELLPQRRFQRLQAPGDRRVVDGKRPGGG